MSLFDSKPEDPRVIQESEIDETEEKVDDLFACKPGTSFKQDPGSPDQIKLLLSWSC